MEKKVFLALALLILFVLGASFALGASIYTKMGTKPSQLYNLTNSTTYWILGFRVWSNIDDSLTQIIINTTTEGSSFNPANDLEALTTPGSNAGVQIYRDTNTNGVYDADTDAGVTSGASWSSWGASGNGYKSTMSGITAGTYNVSKGEPTTDNFFVIVKTRVIDGQKLYPTDAVKFNTTISEVRTNSNTTGITPPPHTNVTSNTLTIDGSNPTISQFITRDNNSNGYIEGIEVTFSEPINDNTLNSTMANYCFRVRGADDGLMIWTTGTARNDTIIEINFTQIQFTNMTPTVNYTMNDTCGITDVAGNFLQSIANTVSIDGAPPVFMGVGSANSCYSYDNDKDGNLNNMNCSMSENISLNTITTNQFKAFVNSGGAATNNMQLTISSVSNVSRGPDQNNITITFNDAIAGTGNASLNYSGNSLFDSKGNRTPSNFTIGVVDSAGPVWTDVVTRDNNSNGNVEGFKITFTEDVADNSLGTNISFCFRVLNSDDASVTSNTGDGVNDNVLFLNFTQQTWTNTTPTINYTANNSCSFSDASPPGSSILSALQPNKQSVDGAPPVFLTAASWDTDNDGKLNIINFTMSENVTTSSSLKFVNVWAMNVNYGSPTENRQIAGAGIVGSSGPGNNITWNVNDVVYGTGNVSLNYVAAADAINDTQRNHTLGNSSVTITDNAAPIFLYKGTLDNDNNGWIDAFQLNFSEGIGNYTYGTTKNAFNATHNFSIGFLGSNLSSGVGAGATCGVADALCIPQADIVIDPDNSFGGVNDSVIFLNLTRGKSYNFSSGYSANVTFSPNGTSLVEDMVGNDLLANVSAENATDGAAPVFWSAIAMDINKDGSVDFINLSLSEQVSGPTISTDAFEANVSYGKDGSGNSITRQLSINGAPLMTNTSDQRANITIKLDDAVIGTGTITLLYNYSATNGAYWITDKAGLKAAGNSSIVVTDNASAVVLTEYTVDGNTNGYLDAIKVNFSESVLDSSFADAADNITVGSIARASITFSTGDVINDNVVFLNFSGTTYNTGATPNVNFSINSNNGTSNMTDLSFLNISSNTTDELSTDKAVPVFLSAYTTDEDKNGALDTINLSMSETLAAGVNIKGTWAATVNYGPATRTLTISSVNPIAAGNVTLKLNNAVFGTGAMTLSYTTAAGGVNDSVGNAVPTNASVTVSDNASAVIFSEQTVDGNTNGYLDAIKVNFSEPILDSSFTDTGDNITVGSISRGSITFNTGDTVNDDVVFLNFSGTTYNTGNTPIVNFSLTGTDGTSNMTDLSFVNISSNTTDEASTDKAVPVFLTAYTTDEDKNGALDTINLSMSETLAAGVNIKGTWAATVNYGPATRTLTISSVNPIAAGNVTLKLNNAVFGTGAMTLSYTTAAGGVNDSVGNAVPTNASVTVSDNASAVIFSEQTVDGNTNGYLDAIKVNFSEPILDSSFTDTGDNITVGSISRGSITFNTGDTVNDDVVFLNFSGTTYNTGNTPIVNFSLTGTDGTSNMTDLSFVNISSNTTAEASTDKASPVLMTKETLSFNRTGYLDTINITFSESIVDNTSANFTIEGITAAGAIAFVDTAFPGDSGNNNNIFLGFTGTTYFTNGTPTVNYSYGGAATSRDYILDAAGNKAVRNDTANGAAAADKAPPVFLVAAASDGATAANGVDSDDYILFNFSEPIRLQGGLAISNTTVNSSKESGAILYTNATGAAWVGGLDIQVGRFNNTQNTTLNVTFPTAYSNLSAPDVYKFFMNYTISDASGNNPVGQDNKTNVTLTGSFQDVQAPSVSSVWTNDTNANGKIDSIVVTMSENVWNASRRCGLGWNVTGYSVNTALSNCPNNTRVNLTVTELSVFDTNATPAVSYTATVGSIVDLNNNNNLTDYNTTAATDKSPPVLLNATTYDDDADGYIDAYNLTFSENVTDDKFNRTGAATALTLAGSALWTITNATGTLKNDHFVNLQFTDYKNASNFTPDITGSFFNDTANNAMESLASGGLTEYDAAAPQFWLVSGFQGNFTNRSGKDGYVLGTKFRANQNISIKFNVSENVTQPTVTVGGNAATLAGTTNTTEGVQFEYYYTMTTAVSEGSVTLSISASDTKGNPSVSNSRTNTTQNLSTDYRVSRVDRLVLTDQPQDDGLQLKLNWTAVTDADFSRYAFICNMTNSTQLSSLSPVTYSSTSTHTTALITTYHDGTNRTIADGTEYFCLINVTDDVGNVNASMNVSAIPYANANVTIAINKWNLVGTPRSLNNTKLSAHGFASGDLYKYYNSTDATWYDLAQSTDRMNHLKGYWIYNYDGNQANLTYKENTGTSATLVTTTIYTGWNLISSPSNTAGDNVTNVLNDRIGSTKWSIIWYYNASDTSGNGWYYNNPSGTGTLGAFDRDGGYWISITSAGNNTLLTGEV